MPSILQGHQKKFFQKKDLSWENLLNINIIFYFKELLKFWRDFYSGFFEMLVVLEQKKNNTIIWGIPGVS